MKRQAALLLAIILCLGLEACAMKTESAANSRETHTQTTAPEETVAPETSLSTLPDATEAEEEEPISLDLELIGPWHLDPNKNDLTLFANSLDLFPGYREWGNSMEIRGNGEMSWHIGAEGWHGTYAVEGNLLRARLTSDLEQSARDWDFRVTQENGTAGLEMDYQEMTIYWVYGDQEDAAGGAYVPSNWEKATEDAPWKVALAEDLFQKYGVLPKYYEDLGDGIYQVYVEIGGELVPFVAVNSATGDYHG